MRQGVSIQRVMIKLEEETETLKEELHTSNSILSISLRSKMLSSARCYMRSSAHFTGIYTLTTFGGMLEMCKRQYKAWAICHVRGRNDGTNPSNLTKVGIIPAPLEEWHASQGNILPSWRSLFLFRKRIKEKLLSLQTRDKLILGDIYSLSRFAKKPKSKMRLNVY
jgi:hypothetical protein